MVTMVSPVVGPPAGLMPATAGACSVWMTMRCVARPSLPVAGKLSEAALPSTESTMVPPSSMSAPIEA